MKVDTKIKNIFLIFMLIIIPIVGELLFSFIYTYDAVKSYDMFIEALKTNCGRFNPLIPLNSGYTYWIGGSNLKGNKEMFFFILFMGAIIPCAYLIHNKTNLKKYGAISSFFISGIFALFSLIINFVSISMFIPLIKPDSVYDMYYDVLKGDILSDLFYYNPIVYELLYMIMIFILCGLIGCLGYNFYKVFNNHIIAFFIPEVILLALHITNLKYSLPHNISPIIYCSESSKMMQNIKMYIIETIIVILIMNILLVIKIEKIFYMIINLKRYMMEKLQQLFLINMEY